MNTKNTSTGSRFSGILDANRARGEEGEQPQKDSKARARGKSSSAEYVQISAYVRKETHKQARKLLLDDERDRDLSDLIEELLHQWVSSRS